MKIEKISSVMGDYPCQYKPDFGRIAAYFFVIGIVLFFEALLLHFGVVFTAEQHITLSVGLLLFAVLFKFMELIK